MVFNGDHDQQLMLFEHSIVHDFMDDLAALRLAGVSDVSGEWSWAGYCVVIASC